MNNRKRTLTLRVLWLLIVCTGSSPVPLFAQQPPVDEATEIKFDRKWNGVYPVASLAQFPKGQEKNRVGYIGDSATFVEIWKVFHPEVESPEIDFKTQMIVFAKNVRHLNKIDTTSLRMKDGTLVVLSMETKTTIPVSDKVYCSLVLVKREGIIAIQTVDGKIPIK